MSLLETLRAPGFPVVLISSFSCDWLWMERVARCAMEAGARHILFLVDASRLALALPQRGALAPEAGRSYLVLPVAMPGAFHAKLALQLGAGRARLTVSSANLTLGSHLRNLEVSAHLDAERDPRLAPLVGDAFRFLGGFCDRRVRRVDAALSAAEALAPTPGAPGRPVLLDDGSVVALLRVPGELSLYDQLRRRVGVEPLRRVVVLSAFWDRYYGMLKVLKRYWRPERLVVLVPDGAHHRADRLERIADLELRHLTGAPFSDRYAHAKLILAEGICYDHLFAGSANCTFSSMGRVGGVLRNAEASIYHRLPAGSALTRLGLDVDALPRLTLEGLGAHLGSKPPWLDAPPHPGIFEARAAVTRWWWAPGLPKRHLEPPLELAALGTDGETHAWFAERERGEGWVDFEGPSSGVVQPCAQGEPITGRGLVL